MSDERASTDERPKIGDRVTDTATGRVGILRAVEEWVDSSKPAWLRPPPRLMAWLWPEGGGTEWMTEPENVEHADRGQRAAPGE